MTNAGNQGGVFALYMAEGLNKDQFKKRYNPLNERKKQMDGLRPKSQPVEQAAVSKIDELVLAGLQKADQKPNAPASAETLVRRLTSTSWAASRPPPRSPHSSTTRRPRRSFQRQRPPPDRQPFERIHRGYPANPKTIGEMIRKRWLDLGLRQVDVARIIGCDEMTIVNWEKGHRAPRVNHMAGVVEFLGFNPPQNGDTMAHRIMNHRKSLGITQKEFARQIGIDPSTLSRMERRYSGT